MDTDTPMQPHHGRTDCPPISDAATPEPPPVPGQTAVLPLVLADLHARIARGIRDYGGPLMTFNGRRALLDAYQEHLDEALYLRQWLEELPRFTLHQKVRYRPHHNGPAWDHATKANAAPSPCDTDGWHQAPWRVVGVYTAQELWHTRPVVTYALALWDTGDLSRQETRPVVPVAENQVDTWREEGSGERPDDRAPR